jgi:hypothetical protein
MYDKLGPIIKKPVIGSTFKHVRVLGALAKLRKARISFLMSVRPSVSMKKLGPHWTDFQVI